jgi:hypothetical protein
MRSTPQFGAITSDGERTLLHNQGGYITPSRKHT